MNFKVTYKQKELEEMGYSQIPLRQIMMLDLTSNQRDVLLTLFSHSKDYKVSHNQIRRMFFHQKRLDYISNSIKELIKIGYLTENKDSLYIDLERIQSDYMVNSNEMKLKRAEKKKKDNISYRNKTSINQQNNDSVASTEEDKAMIQDDSKPSKNDLKMPENGSAKTIELNTINEQVKIKHKSLYFGRELNQKMIELYDNSKYLKEMDYYSFEKLFLYVYNFSCLNTPAFNHMANRVELIKFLKNPEYVEYIQSIINIIDNVKNEKDIDKIIGEYKL
jgi:hypothetical protein